MTFNLIQKFKTGFFAILISLSQAAFSAGVNITTQPLVNSTTADVLPNLMYILDNSGSMGWHFMPDYVVYNNSNCKGSNGIFNRTCGFGDPPYNSYQFNSVYYNPAIRYAPALDGNGVAMPSMTAANTSNWTAVPNDVFGRQNSQVRITDSLYPSENGVTASLVPVVGNANSGYADRAWCTVTNPSVTDLNNPAVCRTNTEYTFPDLTYSNLALKRGFPYYYTIGRSEYCTDAALTNCQVASAPTGSYVFPATHRWCTDATRTVCQGKFLDTPDSQGRTFQFVKWPTLGLPGQQASGNIRILPQTPANSPSASPQNLFITAVKVDGVSIIAPHNAATSLLSITDTTSATQRNTLAARVRDAINSFVPASGDDFVAASLGDTVTITRVQVGAYVNPYGQITVDTTTATAAGTTGTKAVGSITIDRAEAGLSINSIVLTRTAPAGTTTVMSGTTGVTGNNSPSNRRLLATQIKNAINNYVGDNGAVNYVATCNADSAGNCNSTTVTITAINTDHLYNRNYIGVLSTNLGGASVSSGAVQYSSGGFNNATNGLPTRTYTLDTDAPSNFTGGGGTVPPTTFNRVDITPANAPFPKAATRTDCVADTTCSYAEEMTNFANWYSYYRTRLQLMKTSTSFAFKDINTRYRVGFITIDDQNNNYLPVGQFNVSQKNNWYTQLFSTPLFGGTPLRAALSVVGRIYAGRQDTPVGATPDPMQYSCQQNYSILTTDGYWNGNAGGKIDGSAMTDQDGGVTPRPMFQGVATGVGNQASSLADVAKYYYDTDLRTPALGNCTGGIRPDGSAGDVCENNVFVTPSDNNTNQHMTTFTLGLGVDSTIAYQADYQTATTGDFAKIKDGSLNWPAPIGGQTQIDDLWHAAVNGQGTYFSAKDPNTLSNSLNSALQSIGSKRGAGSAAASSNVSPIAGDNYTFVPSYITNKWTGNLEAREIDVTDGKTSLTAIWCVEDVVTDICDAPSAVQNEGAEYFCVTPNATATSCATGSILDGTNCKKPISPACTGTLKNKVAVNSDSRTIYMNVGGGLGEFSYTNIAGVGLGNYFENTFLSGNLSQWAALSPDQKTAAVGDNLVNYLRGRKGFEDRTSNFDVSTSVDNRLFRLREAVLGDALESTAVYVGPPRKVWTDLGYGPDDTVPGSFRALRKDRLGTVYMGTNDGMLHAFDAKTGEERWAYVPTIVIPNMWKLADKNYASEHRNFVNGEITVQDYCPSATGCTGAQWKTMLVGALNGGGKGYYALDITNPTTPVLLWEFGTTQDADLGFSFGRPYVTKKADGTWVVLVTSGYNNSTGPNAGKGILYVLNASTGAIINKILTPVGDATTPSGLAKIANYTDSIKNNTSKFVYGGDLLGNLWRFDINNASSPNPFLVTTFGSSQPITTEPEFAEIKGSRVIYIGTGKYLETSDLSDTQQQSIYAIADNTNTTLANPRNVLVQQTMTGSGADQRQVTSTAPVNFSTDRGWFVDLPDTGEKAHLAPKLVFGTIIVPSVVPNSTDCSPGGYGYFNAFDYRSGGSVVASGVVSTRTSSPPVGVNVFFINGKPVASGTVSSDTNPSVLPIGFSPTGTTDFGNHGVIWRELIDEE